MRHALIPALLTLCCLIAPLAHAWHDEGHVYIARGAIEALPEDVPAFFRDGAEAVAHGSLDPDVIRSRDLPQLRAANYPEHYLDLEYLQGREWPEDRYAYIKLCHEMGVEPNTVGTLPYAIAELTQRLTMAFAEHRKHPDNEHIRRKCLVIAGELSHYTADLHMPLHTTWHYNGIAPLGDDGMPIADAPKQHEGIHAAVDALPTKLPYNVIFAEPLPEPKPQEELMPLIQAELLKSHALVDRTYELVEKLPAMEELAIEDAEVRAFTIDRTRAGAHFTACIFLTAWRNSAELETPHWLDRNIFDEDFDPDVVPPQPAHE
ncbi:MAG: hypothetical protein GVY24_02380 [Planctomycetes bacterium]|jgi:hypothetical protein|nr:hypothetical protein [Planctomycetota bacterium]